DQFGLKACRRIHQDLRFNWNAEVLQNGSEITVNRFERKRRGASVHCRIQGQNRVIALAAQNSWGRQQQGANDTRGKQRSQWLYSHPARPIVFRLRAGSGQAIQNIELLRYRDLARDVSLSSSRRRLNSNMGNMVLMSRSLKPVLLLALITAPSVLAHHGSSISYDMEHLWTTKAKV